MKALLKKKTIKSLFNNNALQKAATPQIGGGFNQDDRPSEIEFTREDINYCVANGRPCNPTELPTRLPYTRY